MESSTAPKLLKERVKPQTVFLKFLALAFISAFFIFGITCQAHAAVSVSISPTSTSTISGATTTFMATVLNASNTAVTWSAVNGTISSSGIYTAPSVLGTSTTLDTITATSVQDNTKSATATVTISSGLVGYWPLNEGMGTTAYDYSGNNATGSWNGTPGGNNGYYTSNAIVGPYAGTFNGSNDYVNLGNGSVHYNPITVAAWINAQTFSAQNNIVSKGYDGANTEWSLTTSGSSTGKLSWSTFNNGSGNIGITSSAMTLATGTWYYVVGTYDGTSWRLYVNGSIDSTVTATGPISTNQPYEIGSVDNQGNPINFFNGSIDDVRIYNRALSGSRIAAMYNGGK